MKKIETSFWIRTSGSCDLNTKLKKNYKNIDLKKKQHKKVQKAYTTVEIKANKNNACNDVANED